MKKAVRAAVLAMAVGAAAQAAETNTTEIVVTASRNSRQAHQIPANVTVVTAEDIDKGGYNSIVDALGGVGGISVRSSSGNESQAEIQMRGFGENAGGKILVLLDGQKLNRPDMAGVNWLQIPVGSVERMEILRGSDSVLYGDQAVAGVINIVTRKGTKEPALSTQVSGGSYGRNTERAAYSASGGKLSYSLNAERDAASGYRDRSAFTTWGAGGGLSCDFSDVFNVGLGLSFNKQDYELPGWLTKEQMEEDPRQSVNPADSAENKNYNINLGGTYEFGDDSRAMLSLAFGRKDISSDMTSWFSYADWVIDSFGVMPKCEFNSTVLGYESKLLVGVDFYLDNLDISRFAEIERLTGTSTADVEKRTLGAYLRDEVSITDALVLGLGGRVESATVSAEETVAGDRIFNEDKTHDASAANLSLIYNFMGQSKVFARVGTVYRYPFVDEQVSYLGFLTDQFNTNLEAEAGTDMQIGADVAMGKTVKAGLTFFLMNMRDEIAFNPATWNNENLDKTRHSGAEANVAWAATEDLALDASYTRTEAVFTDGPNDGKDIPLVPGNAASAGATLALPRDFSIRGVVRYTGAQYLGGDYANAGEKLPSYTVADLILRYTPGTIEGLEAFIAVDNVFGEKYASVGYMGLNESGYYPAEERAFRVGASYRF